MALKERKITKTNIYSSMELRLLLKKKVKHSEVIFKESQGNF